MSEATPDIQAAADELTAYDLGRFSSRGTAALDDAREAPGARPAQRRNEYESHSRDSVKLHAPTVGKPPEYIGHRRCRCIQTAPGDVSGYLHDGSRRERDVEMGHSRIEMIE
jgi:hypothetical protein